MTDSSPFKVEKKDHIAWLTFNQPEKRNTMGFSFFSELVSLFKDFDQDPAVRVVVIKAEGPCFTAGLDLKETASLFVKGDTAARENLRLKILELQESMNVIERCRKPVIAAAHSYCIGGGVDLLCACDIRFAAADTIFSIRETRIAIIADLGTLQRLPTIIGQGWFRELALSGRDFTAREALQMGFITRLCRDRQELYDKALELAKQIAECAPLTVQGVKDVINYSRDNGVYPGLAYVAQKNSAILLSEDLTEAMTAFMEKRKPLFQGK